jgi:DNA polymerase-3 subunit delta'
MKFADIPGHEDIKARLRHMVDNKQMPHALLLEGPAGSGKFSLARALAQYIHCENKTNGDSCGKCPSCQQHQTFNNIDTIYSFPVVKRQSGSPALSNDYFPEFCEFVTQHPFMDFDYWLVALDNINAQPLIYVDEGVELLRRLNFMARQSEYKIVLLWLPERFKEETANKMLKIIEEPNDDTMFILVSNNSRQILPTIYSRCQRVIVKRYSDEEVSSILSNSYSVDPEAAKSIARLAEGNVNTALSLIETSKERTKFLDMFMELMRKAYQRNIFALKQWSADLSALGREQIMRFFEYSSRMLRENFILNLHVPELNAMSPEEMNFSSRFSPFINERNVLPLFDLFNKARTEIAGNANAKIVTFDLAVRVILLLKK